MHEYSVVTELINSLVPAIRDQHGAVIVVHLKKGELRILSDRALTNAFDLLKQGTRLESAALEVETIGVTVSCAHCGYRGQADHLADEAMHFSVPVLSCPSCQSEVDLLTGRELYVDRVTLREPLEQEAADA